MAHQISNDLISEHQAYFEDLERREIEFITFGEPDYPELLAQIYDPPMILYHSGTFDFSLLKNCFAVVGTRSMTDYGEAVTARNCRGIG